MSRPLPRRHDDALDLLPVAHPPPLQRDGEPLGPRRAPGERAVLARGQLAGAEGDRLDAARPADHAAVLVLRARHGQGLPSVATPIITAVTVTACRWQEAGQ